MSERDKKSLKKLDIDAHTDVIWLECEEKSHQEHIQPLVRKRLLEDDKGGVLFSYSHFNILEFRIQNHSREIPNDPFISLCIINYAHQVYVEFST